MIDNLIVGFTTATTISNLAWCFAGVILGTLVGVLPGLGPMTAVALLLPMVYGINDPVGSIICLAGVYYGSQYGGSITAILLKLPGEVSSTVTVLDGYALTQQGRGGAALTIAAVSSFVAGTVAALIMFHLAVPLSSLAFVFGPAEYASLMLLGMLACVAVVQDNLLKGLVMIALGTGLGMIGTDLSTGQPRFTGGLLWLVDGIPFVVLAIGLFGLGEILYNLWHIRQPPVSHVNNLYPNKTEWQQSTGPIARGTLLGTVLGLLPGGGTVVSSFFSYAVEKKLSHRPQNFGRGEIAGLAGPEAANNAAAQAGFLPTLVLGLPVTPLMSLIVAALMINGIQVGPDVIQSRPDLFWGLIASMWIGNLLLFILNIPLVGIWVKILKTPSWILYSLILTIAVLGTYSINNSWFDLLLMLLFGMFGYAARVMRFEVTPMALAFIVGPMFEEYFNRALSLNHGDAMIFVERPISAMLLLMALSILTIKFWFRKK